MIFFDIVYSGVFFFSVIDDDLPVTLFVMI